MWAACVFRLLPDAPASLLAVAYARRGRIDDETHHVGGCHHGPDPVAFYRSLPPAVTEFFFGTFWDGLAPAPFE